MAKRAVAWERPLLRAPGRNFSGGSPFSPQDCWEEGFARAPDTLLALPIFVIRNHLTSARKILGAALEDLASDRSEDPHEELRELGLDRHFS